MPDRHAALRNLGRLPPPGLWQRWVISTGFQSSWAHLYVGNGASTYRNLCAAAKIIKCQEQTNAVQQILS